MDQWWLADVPIVASAIGYFDRRHIQQSLKTEALKRRLDALSLLRGLRREQVTWVTCGRLKACKRMVKETLPIK